MAGHLGVGSLVTLFIVVILSLTDAALVDVCNYDFGAIHHGHVKLGKSNIFAKCLSIVYIISGTIFICITSFLLTRGKKSFVR